jgi:hypothetical protein
VTFLAGKQFAGVNGTVTVTVTVNHHPAAGLTNSAATDDNVNAPGLMVQTTDGSVYPAHLALAA